MLPSLTINSMMFNGRILNIVLFLDQHSRIVWITLSLILIYTRTILLLTVSERILNLESKCFMMLLLLQLFLELQ
jgi:hypothetical protein